MMNEVYIMDQQKVDMFIMTNQKFFPAEKIMYLKDKLRTMDEEKFSLISTIDFKDPTTILLVSIFLGSLGIDRFMIGDTGMGILKLLTLVINGLMHMVSVSVYFLSNYGNSLPNLQDDTRVIIFIKG